MIQKRLDVFKKDADGWSPSWSGDKDYSIFGVSNGTDTYVVNLKEKTCACRKWELSGIPCCHAIACMRFNNQNPDEFVSHWYRKATFLDCYNNLILPNNGPKLWPIVDSEPLVPPYVRRAPGRPKKLRRRTHDEPQSSSRMKKDHNTVRCKRCGVLGHNQRTCKGKTAADRMIPKGGNKDNTKLKHLMQVGTKTANTSGTKAGNTKSAQAKNTKIANTNSAQVVQTVQAQSAQSPRRCARKRKVDETEALGTQQSVNKP